MVTSLSLVMVDAVHDLVPAGEIRLRRVTDPESAQHFVVQPRLVILQRHVVNVAGIERGNHRGRADVAEQGDLFPLALRQWAVTAAEQDLGLNPEARQLAHGLLGGLGLELPRRSNPWHQGGMDAHGLVAAEIVPQLPDRFDERQALDVPDGAADLANHEIAAVGVSQREFLDGVGDMRDHLDGCAEIVSSTLLGDDVAIDAAGRNVVRLARRYAGESLIMAEIEVGLRAVVGHIDFAMLVRRHRARVDVQIRIEFPDSDLVATRLEKRPEGR